MSLSSSSSTHPHSGSSSSSSSHGGGSTLAQLRRTLVDSSEDKELNAEEYEDVRCELRATGHNLVSD